MNINIDFFIESLEREPKKIKKEVGFVYEVLKNECAKALSNPERLPKRYFEKVSKAVFSHHRSDAQFNALRICILSLYDSCLTHNERLNPPSIYLRPDADLPYFNEDAPKLQHCEFALYLTTQAIMNCTSDEALFPLLVLLFAKQTQTTSMRILLASLNAKETQLVFFSKSKIAILTTKSGRIILDGTALGAFLKIKSLQPKNLSANQLTTTLNAVINKHALQFNLSDLPSSPTEILEALTFLQKPLTSSRLSALYKPLSTADFVQACAGQWNYKDNLEGDEVAKTRKRRSVREFLSLEKVAQLFSADERRNLAIDTRAKSEDSHLLETLRKNINAFKNSVRDEKRNTREFKLLKESVLDTMLSIQKKTSETSLVATAVATYTIDLLLFGSHFKSRLAINTILTYLSTLYSFAARAWGNEELLRQAQTDDMSMEALTEQVANFLSDLRDSSQQSTVINFLQYLFQASTLRLYDADMLEYFGAGQVCTRAHYVSPQDFEAGCDLFMSLNPGPERRQFILCAKLAYFGGLRKLEAAQLLTSEIRHDLEAVYVSRVFKRKTRRAYRKIPFCFLPEALISDLYQHIESRQAMGREQVFDRYILSNLAEEFLAALRQICAKDELVFHSLRHGAINNVYFQLQLCVSKPLRKYRETVYFLGADIFDDNQLNRIHCALQELGRRADEHLPILDIVAQIAGHISPTVTASSYLHLLDLAFHIKSSTRDDTPETPVFLRLLPENKYRFELKKQYEATLHESPNRVHDFLFQTFSRGKPNPQKIALNEKPKNLQTSSHISFSDFIHELKSYKESVAYGITDNSLNEYFKKHAHHLTIDFLSELTSGKQAAAWLRTLEALNTLKFNNKEISALRTLTKTLEANEITDIRFVERHLRGLQLLGFSNLKICLVFNGNEDGRFGKWKETIEKFGFQVSLKINTKPKTPFILPKPESHRSVIWKFLPAIVRATLSFHYFQKSNTRKTI